MCLVSESKTRDEVGPTDNVVWVEKAKCAIFEGWSKLEPIQSFSFPPGSVSLVYLEPMDPNDIHADLIRHCWSVEDINSEDPKDLCIGVWVNFVLRESHYMRPILHVHPILAPPEIICCIVDVHRVPLFKTIFRNMELVAVLCGERRWLAGVVLPVKDTGEKVVFELHNKVLQGR